jgi:hypothetical protein
MQYRLAFISFCSAALMALSAEALTLKNVTDEPHTVIVEFGGGVEEITVAPNSIKQVGGIPLRMKLGKGKTRTFITFDDEWTIWGPNDLHIQRRLNRHRRP